MSSLVQLFTLLLQLTLARVPVEESLPPEHGGELLGDALEDLLDGRRVPDEGGRHAETAGRHVAHGRLHVVGDPLHEVAEREQIQKSDVFILSRFCQLLNSKLLECRINCPLVYFPRLAWLEYKSMDLYVRVCLLLMLVGNLPNRY